jgi:E3 ubiquitin-protein ligase DOA10
MNLCIGVHDASMKVMVFSSAYPIMLCIAVVFGAVTLVMKLIRLWLRIVKDDAYLVGKQLHNLDGQPLSNSLADDYKD